MKIKGQKGEYVLLLWDIRGRQREVKAQSQTQRQNPSRWVLRSTFSRVQVISVVLKPFLVCPPFGGRKKAQPSDLWFNSDTQTDN